MEEYKRYLFACINHQNDKTIEEVEERIKDNPRFIINRNEEGKIHSHYVGNRYKPAIIHNIDNLSYVHYYLFDGDVRDCTHPFTILYAGGTIICVKYYSSERIINGKPNIIMSYYTDYNIYSGNKILDEYESKYVEETNEFENFTLICDEMENDMASRFNFAD